MINAKLAYQTKKLWLARMLSLTPLFSCSIEGDAAIVEAKVRSTRDLIRLRWIALPLLRSEDFEKEKLSSFNCSLEDIKDISRYSGPYRICSWSAKFESQPFLPTLQKFIHESTNSLSVEYKDKICLRNHSDQDIELLVEFGSELRSGRVSHFAIRCGNPSYPLDLVSDVSKYVNLAENKVSELQILTDAFF